MQERPDRSPHPGAVVRERVIPQGMTVTEAAKRLGVGRPALSNLLNGRSALSPDMAVRLEKAFGADREELLDLQTALGRYDLGGKEQVIPVPAYAPPFLDIKAKSIHGWADGIGARSLLPVLLRKLVHSTGRDLRRVDFPGGDNAERKGWDGTIEADTATPWIPGGTSGWEFGTGQKPGRKADNDYMARIRSTPPAEREKIAFVFVTPRNWSGKNDWASARQAEGQWRDVRALDASDLEQWLEHAVPAQMWMAEQLELPTDGFDTLDRRWTRWAEASDPPMTPAIFDAAITEHRDTLKNWLSKDGERPLVVTADSWGEAAAFLACAFRRDDVMARWRDLATIFHSAPALRKLASSEANFIPIVRSEEAEHELSSIYRRRHCIVVRPSNDVRSTTHIALRQLNRDAFATALADMGIDGDQVDRLARETGRSPTILRRRRSKIPAIRTPRWADAETARELIPLVLIGAWRDDFDPDREILSTLASTLTGRSYAEIEATVARLLELDDSPVWSVGRHRGVVSKMDAFFAISGQIVEIDLDDFFLLAEYVLAEEDPALDLPESDRWAAALYGKVRHHSDVLRDGIRETLVILSVHGNDLLRARTGIDVEGRVALLVRSLLTPLTVDKLLSHDRDLPSYAEADPDTFLNLIEEDLRRSQPAVFGLLKPVENTLFSPCPRTGLLWALECLAWKNLGRVSPILARLSSIEIHDNYANKPIASLESVYRCWLPQTAAPPEERINSLRVLAKRFPDIGWAICMAQLYGGPRMALPNYRPRWRNDATGIGHEAVTVEERHAFIRESLDIALDWPQHDHEKLGDLVEKIQWMGEDEEDERRIWDLVDKWANSEQDQNAKAILLERIRESAFTRRAIRQGENENTLKRARAACARLRPEDSVIRNARFFTDFAVDFNDADVSDEDMDYEEREARADRLRSAAMKEVWTERGHKGIVALMEEGGIPHMIGFFLSRHLEDEESRIDFLRDCLSHEGALREKMNECIRGFLRSADEDTLEILIRTLTEGADAKQASRLFLCMPFGRRTWRLLDDYPQDVRDRYWREVAPERGRYDESELAELLDCLFDVERPAAAFRAAFGNWSQVETSRLKRLLFDFVTAKSDPIVNPEIEAYQISNALGSLNGRADVSVAEMARLEFAFLEPLDRSEHGIPNLERQIVESPDFFVYILAIAFKRADKGQDPPQWRIEDTKQKESLSSNARRLFDRIYRIPGTDSDGEIDAKTLENWIGKAREFSARYGRAEIGDIKIGRILSRAPAEKSGLWPCDAVCEALERFSSRRIRIGFNRGVHNARGVSGRKSGEGGMQERELAAKYRSWARRRAVEYPFVSSILGGIAESYDREAERWDDEAEVEERLMY